ncbi:hypothetical protein [uncultured Apibacter sp.]|uniref:hypothetical protein n=1 Tax=uncultured Apibacter sp. TaxID=1778616 RepID=UPI0025F40741|nr:hypothetical protein [uncultured Apibacter sp.]
MSIIERKKFNIKEDENSLDKGVSVKKCLDLLDEEFRDSWCDLLKINEIKDEFIAIKGANTLVNAALSIEKKLEKFDIISEVKNIRFQSLLDKNNLNLMVSNIEENKENIKALEILETDYFVGKAIYSVKSDFLDGLYSVDKFFNHCLENDYKKIIEENIKLLEYENQNNEAKLNLRILRNDNNELFIRAITSTKYKDYNIKFSLFITLITLHRLIEKNKGDNYYVQEFSIGDSDIRVIFTKQEKKPLIDKSLIGFSFELINDEIKRQAVKLRGIFNISFDDEKRKEDSIFIKPESVKSDILSFTHVQNIEKLKDSLISLEERITFFEEELYLDAEKIKTIKNPDQFREYLYQKVNASKNSDFSEKYRFDALKILTSRANTLMDLLDVMRRVELLIDLEDVAAKDYWRIKIHEVLVLGRKME